MKKPHKVKNKAESAEAAGAESKADGEAAGSADGEGAAGAESKDPKKKGDRPPKEASSAAVAARDALLNGIQRKRVFLRSHMDTEKLASVPLAFIDEWGPLVTLNGENLPLAPLLRTKGCQTMES